jgi:hypothetical protein
LKEKEKEKWNLLTSDDVNPQLTSSPLSQAAFKTNDPMGESH